MADRSYLAGLIPPPTAGATVNSNLNLFDLPPEGFRSYLNELAAQGVNTDELMRQYRRANSPFSGLFDWAINSERDIANEGRTTAGAGLFSKEAGTTGMDALASTRIEPANFIAGLLSGGAQAVDAAGATLKGLVPAADMPMEALGTAGMAMTGGAAMPKPRGALGANSLRQFDVTRKDASGIFGQGTERVRYTDPQSGGTMEVVVRPDGSASVLELEVPEASRGQGVGQSLQERVLQDYPVMGGQVSSKAAATTAYRLGRRPYGQPDATLDDVFRMIDEDSSVNLISPQAQPNTLPAARNEAERMARQILEMRAAGRAGDVTDAMMAQADPQYMFNNTPLPMDEASRMARAGEMGFDTPAYHGTTGDFQSARGDFYTTPNTEYANIYAGSMYDEGGRVLPLMQREGDILDTRKPIGEKVFNEDFYMQYGNASPLTEKGVPDWVEGPDFGEMFADKGLTYKGVFLDEGKVPLGDGTLLDRGISTLHFDPTNIRSSFARFDPEFSHLANLNAANASPLAGILAMPNEEERNRQLGMLFGGYR